jgi:hypothetical protein
VTGATHERGDPLGERCPAVGVPRIHADLSEIPYCSQGPHLGVGLSARADDGDHCGVRRSEGVRRDRPDGPDTPGAELVADGHRPHPPGGLVVYHDHLGAGIAPKGVIGAVPEP